MEARIREGRDHYATEKYDAALRQFTRAMNMCACTRGMRRPRCTCKDFEAVAAENGSIFDEAMHTCRCHVGRTFNKCDNLLHIQALDYRAGTFEAMKELGRARKDAEWMLELAPRRPDGYLRFGKVARLQKKAELAWKMYGAGIEASKDAPVDASTKRQQLYAAFRPLQARFKRQDPMSLPYELVHIIFSHLDVVELTKCLLVSKAWGGTLQCRGYKTLWRSFDFPTRPFQPPSTLALQKLLARARGDVREIVIRDPTRFQLSQQRLMMLLRAAASLERLELGPLTEYYFLFPKGPALYRNLRHVVLDMYNNGEHRSWHAQHQSTSNVPVDFIKSIAATLESLSLVGVPASWCQLQDVPEFPALRCLRLEHKRGSQAPFPILYMASRTPRLEQLCLTNVHLTCDGLHRWKDIWHMLWRSLQVVVFTMPDMGQAVQSRETLTAVTSLMCLHSSGHFRYVDLQIPYSSEDDQTTAEVFPPCSESGVSNTVDAHGRPIRRPLQLHSLRQLRLKDLAHGPSTMRHLLGGAAERGNLHTLDIVFPIPTFHSPVGRQHMEHLGAYGWLRGVESIRSLGISRFRFREYPTNDDDLPLPSFLATFPNLETLSLTSDHYAPEEFCSVVEAILNVTHLKVLYQNKVNGALMDKLVRLGETFGVQVIWGERPRVWPVPPEE
ncbi:hypothetical protein RJ55_02229 [Drechmeria coniospora]|nr:hypothetical protein RJ55_02229 [Drechmeria coniospora]